MSENSTSYKHRPVALAAEGLDHPMTLIDVARIVHEANRGYCDSIGDGSQVPWDLAPGWQKDSCLAGVRMLILNPECSLRDQHESWYKKKVSDGWTWGPVKDAEKKEHPAMRPWAELPSEQKIKNVIFRGLVMALRPFVVWE